MRRWLLWWLGGAVLLVAFGCWWAWASTGDPIECTGDTISVEGDC